MWDFAQPKGDADEAPVAPRPWSDADLRRAIGAAQTAGLECYRVEIAPDGTITIIVGG